MSFFKRHKCHIDFNNLAVMLTRRELACVDKFGRPLAVGVQVVQRCTIPGCFQATARCRMNCRNISNLGVVEGVLGESSSQTA